MQRTNQNFFILTGGPGSGKTTLLDALEERGYTASVEAGRAIIQHCLTIDAAALPWKDPALFAELMLSWELRSYDLATQHWNTVFFDRGFPDLIGYLRLSGIAVPSHFQRAAQLYRYNDRVFILPPWPEIYAQDTERKQNLNEAERTYHAMVRAYGDAGYDLIDIPCVPVSARTDFILEKLKR